jgi:hypothetical protein
MMLKRRKRIFLVILAEIIMQQNITDQRMRGQDPAFLDGDRRRLYRLLNGMRDLPGRGKGSAVRLDRACIFFQRRSKDTLRQNGNDHDVLVCIGGECFK